MRRDNVRAVALLAVYAAIVVWLTWPLASKVATYLPAPDDRIHFDTLRVAWSLAWESHALTTSPARLLDANIYHPAPHALLYGQLAIGALPYFMPTFLLTGSPVLALNLTFLASIALTAWILHLVVLRWTGSHLGGFIAAWTFLMTRWTLWEWPAAATNYAVLQYFPLIVLMAATPARRFARSLWLVPIIVLQGLSDLYVAVAVLVPLGLLCLIRLTRPATRGAGLRLAGVLALASIVLIAAYSGQLLVYAENPGLHQQTLWSRPTYTALPWGLFGRGYFGFLAPTGVPFAALALIVAGALSLLLGARRQATVQARQGWAHGTLWAVMGIALSMTPAFFWQARTVHVPFLLEWVPMFEVLRQPSRLGIATLIGLSLLAGIALAECGRWFSRLSHQRRLTLVGPSLLAAAVGVVMYAEYSHDFGKPELRSEPLPRSYPMKRSIQPDTPIMDVLRESQGPLLELPFGGQGTEAADPHAAAMYRSIFHWRPLLNGYGSYWPAGFQQRMALARRLPHPKALATLRRETNLEMILVHLPALNPIKRAEWLRLAGRDDLRLVTRLHDDLLFAVTGGPRSAPPRGTSGP
jgi:hypothetical protein